VRSGRPIAKLPQKKRSSAWLHDLGRALLSLAFVSFVGAAVAGIASPLFFAILLSACLVIAVMRTSLSSGRLFPIAFASLLAVYAATRKLEAFIERHRQIRVLEVIKDFEGMDTGAFWHDVKFSLRHVQDFSRIAIVTNPDVHHLWSSLVAPFMRCDVEHFSPGEMEAARDWLMWPEGAVD
jgi:SpoIIAA-like